MAFWTKWFAHETAQLINRGEQFMYSDGIAEYTGECVWSWKSDKAKSSKWEKEPNFETMPESAYPIIILANTIKKSKEYKSSLSEDEKIRIAMRAKEYLEKKSGSGAFCVEN